MAAHSPHTGSPQPAPTGPLRGLALTSPDDDRKKREQNNDRHAIVVYSARNARKPSEGPTARVQTSAPYSALMAFLIAIISPTTSDTHARAHRPLNP
jgi:hypothetical protein